MIRHSSSPTASLACTAAQSVLRYASNRRGQSTAHGFLCRRASLHKSTIDPRQGLFTPISFLWAGRLPSIAYPLTRPSLPNHPWLCFARPRPDPIPSLRPRAIPMTVTNSRLLTHEPLPHPCTGNQGPIRQQAEPSATKGASDSRQQQTAFRVPTDRIRPAHRQQQEIRNSVSARSDV